MTQLALGLDLESRLRGLGLPTSIPVVLHGNARVLVTRTARGVLRVHRGYAFAPDRVLLAIITWAKPALRRPARLAAQRLLTAFPVHEHVPPGPERRRAGVPRPGDARLVERLRWLHAELNHRHFGGALGPVRIGLSHQMRRRLGEFRPPCGPAPAALVLSRQHLRRDGWEAAAETFLHEMIHQWQAETGQALAHDPAFREKAAEVGIDGGAVRRDYLSSEGAVGTRTEGADWPTRPRSTTPRFPPARRPPSSSG
ncbi:MAG: SprT-like domain-containing protein [Gemmatimonadales bacterium]